MSETETVEAVPAVETRGPKWQQLLAGARRIFMEQGYEGASVDEIARAAGTSKATLYSYFPDKRQLFEAVVRTDCSAKRDMFCGIDDQAPVEETLRRFALGYAGFVLSPEAHEMFRTCIAEAGRFPELGRTFYASGPAKAHGRLVAYFLDARDRGELAFTDVDMAAHQFVALCKAGLFLRALLAQPAPDATEIAATAEEAVRTFLARFGTAAAERGQAAAE